MENLGKIGRDKITGFVGTITAKCFYLYGCAQYSLNPKVDKDGKTQAIQWLDIGRIEVIEEGIKPEEVKTDVNGCEHNEHP